MAATPARAFTVEANVPMIIQNKTWALLAWGDVRRLIMMNVGGNAKKSAAQLKLGGAFQKCIALLLIVEHNVLLQTFSVWHPGQPKRWALRNVKNVY